MLLCLDAHCIMISFTKSFENISNMREGRVWLCEIWYNIIFVKQWYNIHISKHNHKHTHTHNTEVAFWPWLTHPHIHKRVIYMHIHTQWGLISFTKRFENISHMPEGRVWLMMYNTLSQFNPAFYIHSKTIKNTHRGSLFTLTDTYTDKHTHRAIEVNRQTHTNTEVAFLDGSLFIVAFLLVVFLM